MSKQDPLKMPLKGSTLSPQIVAKLGKLTLANPDAPGFKPKAEKIELVRHLIWAVHTSQKKTKIDRRDISVSSLAEILSLNSAEVDAVLGFIERTTGASYYRTTSFSDY